MKGTAFSPSNGALYIEHVKNRKKHDMVQQHYHDAYEIYLQLDGRRYAFYDNICYTLKRLTSASITFAENFVKQQGQRLLNILTMSVLQESIICF